MDTARLISGIKARDSEALTEFQTAFTPLLRYIISPILPDESDREECLADVFLLVWERISSYDPQRAALTTWLTVLARNTALNRLRGVKCQQETSPLDESLADPSEGPEEVLLRKERQVRLQSAIVSLSARDRTLFLRKYYYFQSTAQIAAELGCTERSVEGRLYRIRKKLQKELGGDRHD